MDILFPENSQIKIVNSFSELALNQFEGKTNALCWHRNLVGNFAEIVSLLHFKSNITEVDVNDLLMLELSDEGVLARNIILNDLQLLNELGVAPSLNLLKCYERDNEFDFISTDVYSYHVDRSPISADTFLCTYHGAASDILPNEEAKQKILVPEIRAQLKALHPGPDNEFEDFLKENYFDLHYQAQSNSKPINLGLGHLWRLAVDHPEQKVLPCIHRAPLENDGEYRLLLIC